MTVHQRLGVWFQTTPGVLTATFLVLVVLTSRLIEHIVWLLYIITALSLAGSLMLLAGVIPNS